MVRHHFNRAFSYLEILIVIAILGLLGAVVGVQYNQAYTARGITKVRHDFAVMAVALENYNIDHSSYPFGSFHGNSLPFAGGVNQGPGLIVLTTPITYLTNFPTNPFLPTTMRSASRAELIINSPAIADDNSLVNSGSYAYYAGNEAMMTALSEFSGTPVSPAKFWILQSPGPDQSYYDVKGVASYDKTIEPPLNMIYDPTNGIASQGSLWSASAAIEPLDAFDYAAGQGLILAIQETAGETWYTGSSWKLD